VQRTGLRPGATGAAKIQGCVCPPAVWTARPAADAIVGQYICVHEADMQQRYIQDRLIIWVKKHRVSFVVIWLVAAVIPSLYFFVLAFLTHNLWGRGDIAGFFNDYNFANSLLIAIPLVVEFFFLLEDFIEDCLEGLIKNKVFGPPLQNRYKTVADFMRAMSRDLSSSQWSLLAWTLSALFVAIAAPSHRGILSWRARNAVAFVSMEVLWIVSMWFAVVMLLRAIVAIAWINRLFRSFRIRVRLMHPDKSGGLASLGTFSVRLGYIISAIGFIMAINQLTAQYLYAETFAIQNKIILAAGWGLYFLIAPVAFFAPIGAAHDAMLQAKRKELLLFAREFDKEYQKVRGRISRFSYQEVEESLNKMEEIERLYNIANEFPVWPFQIDKLRRFAASVVSPFLLPIFTNLVVEVVAKHFLLK